MTRSRSCRGLVVTLAGLFLVAGAGACSKTPFITVQSMTLDTSRVAMAEPENDTLATRPATLGGPLGMPYITTIRHRATPTLNAEITTLSETDLRQYLSKLVYHTDVFSTDVAFLPCVDSTANGDVQCGAGDSAIVYIQPDIGMDKWKHDDIPATGLIVARVINYSPVARHEAKFGWGGMRHSWWVVDKDGSGHYRSRFVERTYAPGGPALRVLRSTSWPFTQCMHKDAVSGRPARAKFWDCTRSMEDVAALVRARPEGYAASYFRFAMYRPFDSRAATPYARSGTWVTCAEGCCVAGP